MARDRWAPEGDPKEAAARAARARALGVSEWELEVIEKQGNIGKAMREDLAALSRVQQPRSMATPKPQAPQARGSGWSKPIPVQSPPGVALADRIADHFAALDKAEAIKQALTKRALKKP
jgi:hypothetical protein